MKVFADIIQGSEEWKRIRKGKPTASNFSRIITAAKAELSKQATDYIRELIGECFVPDFEYFTGNFFTERGKMLEPEAREAFIAESGLFIEEVGFVLADDGICGCSPDGLIIGVGGREFCSGLEIKCPTPKEHIGYVLDGVLPDAYRQQVHGSMAVTGLDEWHFWSYFPGLKPLHVVVKRDDYTAKIEKALASFVADYRAAMAIAKSKLQIPADLLAA